MLYSFFLVPGYMKNDKRGIIKINVSFEMHKEVLNAFLDKQKNLITADVYCMIHVN